jgi:hypothetical protein
MVAPVPSSSLWQPAQFLSLPTSPPCAGTCAHTHTCTVACMCAQIQAHTCGNMRSHTRAQLHACVHGYRHTHVGTCAHTHVHSCMYVCTDTGTHMHVHVYTSTRMLTGTQYAHTRAYAHRAQACMCTQCTQRHTCTHRCVLHDVHRYTRVHASTEFS